MGTDKRARFKEHGGTALGRPYRIVIVEDQTIVREGLQSLLSLHPDFEIVGVAEDGLQAIRRVQECKPDLVLLDISMPRLDGLSAMGEIKRLTPDTRILALTIHKAEGYVVTAFKAGADGYCLKDATQDELLLAIRSVLSGKPYLSPGVSAKVLEGYLEGKGTLEPASPWDTLTQREREILKLIGEGYKSKEIGSLLCISAKTVDKHRSNLMMKLDLHTASALTAYAIEKGLVTK
jgi:DNA-binding NarL/FixJ family response regulator